MEHGLTLAWHSVTKIIDGFFSLLPNMLIAAAVFFIFYQISRLANHGVYAIANRARMDQTLAHALARLSAVGVNILGFLVCAMILIPTFSPDKLIAGLGVTSVAIGFAFQNVLQNFFAGILLLWQKPFGIGDEIKVKEYEGLVEDITIRTTLLRTASGQRIYVPNGVLFTEAVTVNTAFEQRRAHIEMAIPAGISGEAARNAAREALQKLELVAKEPAPDIYTSVTDGKLGLDVYFWAKSRHAQLVEAVDEATSAIHLALNKIASNVAADVSKDDTSDNVAASATADGAKVPAVSGAAR